MKKTLTFLSIAALAANASAQSILSEDFSFSTTATFPPTGWTATTVTSPNEWLEASIASPIYTVLLSDAAAHDWSGAGIVCDSWLISPTMSFAGLATPQLTFDSDLYYVNFMTHYAAGPLGNGTSNIELSTDGGTTWNNIWTETAQVDGYSPALTVDLSSYSGQSAVEIAFVYGGDNGHDWGVDNVIVDNGGSPIGPSLALGGTCPGPQSADASGMTPGGPVAFYYALSAGSVTLPSGACAGLTLPVSSPTQLGGFVIADGAGNASISGNTNPNRCGNLMLGAVDVATCTGSNVVML